MHLGVPSITNFVAKTLEILEMKKSSSNFEYFAPTFEMHNLWLIGSDCSILLCCLASGKLHGLIYKRKKGVSWEFAGQGWSQG